jgi:hypothetical protein
MGCMTTIKPAHRPDRKETLPVGKQSRRKRRRRETPESVTFRRHLLSEELLEWLGWEGGGRDWRAICQISALMGVATIEGEKYPVVEPLRRYEDHAEFDRALCQAGVKAFVRRTMDSDQPGPGPPINPETGEPNPSIPPPNVRFPSHVLVQEAGEGIRLRSGVDLEQGEDVTVGAR